MSQGCQLESPASDVAFLSRQPSDLRVASVSFPGAAGPSYAQRCECVDRLLQVGRSGAGKSPSLCDGPAWAPAMALLGGRPRGTAGNPALTRLGAQHRGHRPVLADVCGSEELCRCPRPHGPSGHWHDARTRVPHRFPRHPRSG